MKLVFDVFISIHFRLNSFLAKAFYYKYPEMVSKYMKYLKWYIYKTEEVQNQHAKIVYPALLSFCLILSGTMINSGISSTQQNCLFHFVLHLPVYVQNYYIFINISIFWQKTHKEQKKEICRKSSSVTRGAQHITKEWNL